MGVGQTISGAAHRVAKSGCVRQPDFILTLHNALFPNLAGEIMCREAKGRRCGEAQLLDEIRNSK